MGLLDGFEKLINEHGSAVILKERIALANDKYAALEQKLSASDAANKQLRSENQSLRIDLEKATIEIQNLKNISDKNHGNRLEQVREQILFAVANNPDASDQQLARITGVGELIAKFHLAELKASKMVSIQIIAGSDWAGTSGSTTWSIKQPGLSYLVAHGLIA